jgi:hypothetical protein
MKRFLITTTTGGLRRAVKMWITLSQPAKTKAHPRRGVAMRSLSVLAIAGLLPAPVSFLSSLTNQGVVFVTLHRAVAARSLKENIA